MVGICNKRLNMVYAGAVSGLGYDGARRRPLLFRSSLNRVLRLYGNHKPFSPSNAIKEGALN